MNPVVHRLAPPLWLRWLPTLAVLGLLILAFKDTGWAMVSVWMRSETFAHAFLVPPLSLWLAWRRRAELAHMPLKPMPWLLFVIAALCVMWLVADVASVNAATQFVLVSLLVLTVPAVAGWAVAQVLMFPLLFLFFAVPMGEFLLPSMMSMTADFTVAALRFSGVPVYREGLQFVIPSGSWSVVEACSGVRYLLASFMVGTLFAYLNYHSTKRRLLFVLASIVVPIVANWLRAYMIVMLGHLSGNEIAVGADHLVYGWVFFGIVIGIMFMIGARWSEAPPVSGASAAHAGPVAAARQGLAAVVDDTPSRRVWAVAAGIAALVVGTQIVHAALSRPAVGGTPVLQLPQQLGAWQQSAQLPSDWAPAYVNPSATQHVSYTLGSRTVSLWLGFYRDQGPRRELISSINSLISPASQTWTQAATGTQVVPTASGGLPVATAMLRDTVDPNVPARMRLTVRHLYWVGGQFTASRAKAKALMAWQRLRGAGDDSAAVVLYSVLNPGDASDAVLNDFLATQLGALATTLQAAAAGAKASTAQLPGSQ